MCKHPSITPRRLQLSRLGLLSLFLVGCVQLTVWQIVDVLPQTQEVRVSQRSLGADSAPGVELQQSQSTGGLNAPEVSRGHGAPVSYLQQRAQQVDPLRVQPGGGQKILKWRN